MKTLNKWFFTLLLIVALAPTVFQMVIGILTQMDADILVFVIGAVLIWLLLKYGLLRNLFVGLFALFGNIIRFLASGFNRDAQWMPFWERWQFLSPYNEGLVVDGKNRLTEKVSYQNLLAVAPVGGGKTSNIPIPHALLVNHASILLNDLSGELFEETSGALKKRGYDIQILDLIHVGQGGFFNPLEGLKTHTEIAQVAEVIVSSSGLNQGNSDPFWAMGSQNIIKVFLQALANLNQPEYLNLANLKYLVNSFNMSGALDRFMIRATLEDEPTYQEYKGFLTGNENTINSLITTAQAALSGLNPDLCRITSRNTINFDQLRQRKTALYVMVRQQDIPYLAFLINLFFTKLCHSLLDDLSASRNGLPVHLMLDEFGQFYIPGFDTFAATSRKHRVSFCLLLQSLSQLTTRYGAEQAQTIRNAINSEQYFAGMPIELANQISRRIGQKTESKSRQKPLIREHEVIHLKEDEALLLHGGRDPIRLKLTPYYQQRKLRKLAKLSPVVIPRNVLPEIRYVPLQPVSQATSVVESFDPEPIENGSPVGQPDQASEEDSEKLEAADQVDEIDLVTSNGDD